MQKIISLFKRDYEGTRQIYDELVPGAEWVQAGEGIATVKWDGTCCMVASGVLYRRYDAKHGKTPPQGFVPAQDADPVTGHWPGWLRCDKDAAADKWHMEALLNCWQSGGALPDGTYELVGPKVQGNPYKLTTHQLYRHGIDIITGKLPLDFDGLKEYFSYTPIEGIVWQHTDGRMVKVKRRDFGLSWPLK